MLKLEFASRLGHLDVRADVEYRHSPLLIGLVLLDAREVIHYHRAAILFHAG